MATQFTRKINLMTESFYYTGTPGKGDGYTAIKMDADPFAFEVFRAACEATNDRNFVGRTLDNLFDTLADHDVTNAEDALEVAQQIEADIMTADLFDWFAGDIGNAHFANLAMSEASYTDIEDLLDAAQCLAIQEICQKAIEALSDDSEPLTLTIEEATERGSISHATLRPEDLIPAFSEALSEYWEEKASEIEEAFGNDPEDVDADDQDYWIEELMDALNMLAPEGYYFGAHPGDGSDFGFWQCEDFDAD